MLFSDSEKNCLWIRGSNAKGTSANAESFIIFYEAQFSLRLYERLLRKSNLALCFHDRKVFCVTVLLCPNIVTSRTYEIKERLIKHM